MAELCGKSGMDMLSSGKGLHQNKSELELRFGTSSFQSLRCDRSCPLSVVIKGRTLEDVTSLTKPVVILGTTQKLNVDAVDICSVACEWVECERSSPLHLHWVDGSSEVEEILVVKSRANSFQGMEFLVDLYESSSLPLSNHIGTAKLCPLESPLKGVTYGSVVLAVISEDGREMGEASVSCLLAEPLPHPQTPPSNPSHSWLLGKQTLLGGHRGMGDAHHKNPKMRASMEENTVASLTQASRNGADFVEFDVQLTSDLVPVIYHNFSLCVQSATSGKIFKVLVKDLSLADLRRLKVVHVSQVAGAKRGLPITEFEDISELLLERDATCGDIPVEERIFPTLQEVLELVPLELGFDVEVKYPVPEVGNHDYDFPFLDRGLMADAILGVILPHCGRRNMFLSCFDADMCTILHLKQSSIPVFFLTTNCCPDFDPAVDPRSKTIQSAVIHAKMQDLKGVVMESYQLLKSEGEILVQGLRSLQLPLFTWGNQNNFEENRRRQAVLGVNGVIYDRFGEGLRS